jgi:hypothetical protein
MHAFCSNYNTLIIYLQVGIQYFSYFKWTIESDRLYEDYKQACTHAKVDYFSKVCLVDLFFIFSLIQRTQ